MSTPEPDPVLHARVPETEVMGTEAEALDYDSMDHREVNDAFVVDLLAQAPDLRDSLDLGSGTAQIPVRIVVQKPEARILAVDLSEAMLKMGKQNLARAGVEDRVELACLDAKELPLPDGRFTCVMSNSIVHHLADPQVGLVEMVRVAAHGAVIFVRDLLRPATAAEVDALVEEYAREATELQRQMFHDSLKASLTLDEIRDLVAGLGYSSTTVTRTSDRHWTWATRKA